MNQSVDSLWGVFYPLSGPNGGWTLLKLPSKPSSIEVVFVKHGFNFLWLKFGWSSVCAVFVLCTNVQTLQTTNCCANGSVPGPGGSSRRGRKFEIILIFGFQSVDWRRYYWPTRLWSDTMTIRGIAELQDFWAFNLTITVQSAKSFHESNVKEIIVVQDWSTS